MSIHRADNTRAPSGNSRVNDELTLGYSSHFEKQWWRIEVAIWILLSVFVAIGLTGLFGRGVLAHKRIGTNDGDFTVEFQQIARYKTPEIMMVRLAPSLYRQGKVRLWLNRAIVEDMGLQRIIPESEESFPGENGIAYTFQVQDSAEPTFIWFAKEASDPGIYEEEVKVDSRHDLSMRVFVLP